MDPNIRIPRVQYAELADVYYIDGNSQIIESDQIVPGSQIYDRAQIIDSAMVINGAQIIQGVPIINESQLRNSDGSYIQGLTMYNGVRNIPVQNNFYGTNSSGTTGVIDIESARMDISSNQLTSLNSSSNLQGLDLNYNSSNNISNNSEHTNGDYRIMTLTGGGVGYENNGNNSLEDDDMKLKLDAPPEIAAVDNFVMQNMPDMGNLDSLNFDFDLNAMDLENEGNFPGLDLGNNNLNQQTSMNSFNNLNPNMIQQQPNSASGIVPRITIRTKRTKKPRNNITKEESTSINASTISYPPLEMLGITTPNIMSASNDNIEYNTPIPHISPIYKEESQSPSYSSPVSPSPSTSSYGSPLSPSSDSNSMRPRASLSTMTDAERYRHIREQNNESSRMYRQKKKMSIKQAEAELLLLQEKNTRLKEVFDAIKQKKDRAHTLMRGFVQDACTHKKQ